MKQYKAFISQGSGCDYTIACGETVISLEGTSMEEAEKDLSKIIKENYREDFKLSSAKIFEITKVFAVDVDKLYDEFELEDQQQELKDREEQERKEYERLKNKFE